MKVYLLQHEHDLGDDETDVKTIGIYRTETEALAAQGRLREAPGFSDHPDGFSVDAYELGQDHWTAGFVAARADGDDAGAQTAAA